MTYEKAKVIIEKMRERILYEFERNALVIAKKAIEKQIKYRWHDLRKDPNDLPNKSGCYLVLMDFKDLQEFKVKRLFKVKLFSIKEGCFSSGAFNSNIIAWKEIEPFEEDEE